MNRHELLDKLHNIKIGACISVYTYDMGIQYAYVTPEGYGEALGNMGAWPVFCIESIESDLFESIKEKVKNKTLLEQDMNNSPLHNFYKFVFNNKSDERCYKNIYEFFQDLVNVKRLEDSKLYILCDPLQWKPEAKFFGTYRDLEQEFAAEYIFAINEWEDCTDEELTEWIERIEDELEGILIVNIPEENI